MIEPEVLYETQTEHQPGVSYKAYNSTSYVLPPSVSDSLREKICSGKYVDLYELLYPDEQSKVTRLQAVTDTTLQIIQERKRTLTEREWIMAFTDYMDIYAQNCPGALPSMYRYIRHISEMMHKGQDWRGYDYDFRRRQQSEEVEWHAQRMDLMSKYAFHAPVPSRQSVFKSAMREGKFRQGAASYKASSVPFGYCAEYHRKGGECYFKNCRFNHKCPVPGCSEEHPRHLHYSNDHRKGGRYSRNATNSSTNPNSHSNPK